MSLCYPSRLTPQQINSIQSKTLIGTTSPTFRIDIRLPSQSRPRNGVGGNTRLLGRFGRFFLALFVLKKRWEKRKPFVVDPQRQNHSVAPRRVLIEVVQTNPRTDGIGNAPQDSSGKTRI